MNKLRLVIFLLVALAQIGIPASMIWKRQHTLREGRLWKFRTAPVDPVDAMRGRYLSLRFEAEEFPSAKPISYRDPVYAKLKEDADGFAVVDQVVETPTEGDDVVRAESFGYYEGKAHLRFSFDRLWVTEANAPAAEKAYADHSRREKIDAYATVRVIAGDAGIEELYIAGQPLRDYLRARAP
ncbi:MAG TPA: GDYXXLXY domain-containing protein [Chthoniobacterales bacterium]|nr:GDYXXLXY domain-containing protein [Chthoniobacterales bacterium]